MPVTLIFTALKLAIDNFDSIRQGFHILVDLVNGDMTEEEAEQRWGEIQAQIADGNARFDAAGEPSDDAQ